MDDRTRSIALDVDLALRGQGLPASSRPGSRILAAARRAVELGSGLIRPRFVSAPTRIIEATPEAVRLTSAVLEGATIAQALEGADRVVAVVCTIGPALEARVSSLLPVDPLLAVALDGLGSAACERLGAAVCADLRRQAASERKQVTGPLAPGMIGWPLLDAQRRLFALVDPSPLGVVLSSSGLMIPRKTLSFLVGVGTRARAGAPCTRCEVRKHCRMRPSHA